MRHLFFALTEGLARNIKVPRGFTEKSIRHARAVEKALGPDWRRGQFTTDDPEVICKIANDHNQWVRRLYYKIGEWAEKPPEISETMTPEQTAEFWESLYIVDLPVSLWTADYYTQRMQHAFAVMTGNEDEGVSWVGTPLTPEQAGEVVWLFSHFLDDHDVRLDVPRDCDYLATADEYHWCEKCGCAIAASGFNCQDRQCPVTADIDPDYWTDEEE